MTPAYTGKVFICTAVHITPNDDPRIHGEGFLPTLEASTLTG